MITITFIWGNGRKTTEQYYDVRSASNAATYAIQYNGAKAALRGNYMAIAWPTI